MLEEALQASIVRVDVGRAREGGGELGQIDGFDPESKPAPDLIRGSGQALEQSDDEGGQTGDASPVQASGLIGAGRRVW